ncbi:hypothetical protein CLUG_05675 [Clavispora lusitaniae ATCC 42720]|uniref:Response regulatory domain-containing protein n=2 Tax=Clavispora lusitaniae TaxID=36911 RepID=C4YBU7_CLAL4|nr:uncharacterized protein CLUG_05675 [Clavispora lusitaniae ATCC 42720]ACB38710.1 Ssk1 [Clavispora lusitaniae]EEQ41547.1 hypothetical protein CLUG_05675 [Clavispora lusitaniae ATCC 42720]
MGKHFNHVHNQGMNNSGAHVRNSTMIRSQPSPARRVWVKRTNGTPTTIMVQENDIIDDLKLAVCNKFPHSLGQYYDPADLRIQIRAELLDKSAFQRRLASKKTPTNRFMEASDESSSKSPTPTSYRVNLEPDQNVWELLSECFPNSMSMADALVVDVDFEAKEPFQSTAPTPSSNRMYSRVDDFSNNHSSIERPNSPRQQWINQNKLSPLSSMSDTYHQPKPQHPTSMKHGIFGKNLSISPTFSQRVSPIHPPLHQRSRSNPPQSPITSYSQANKANNSQAVLLIPKNFSFGEQNHSNLKRYSLDESLVNKRDVTDIPSATGGVQKNNESNITIGDGLEKSSSFNSNVSGFDSMPPPNENKKQENQNQNSSEETASKTVRRASSGTAPQKVPFKAPSKGKSNEKTINTKTFEKVLPSISVLVVEDNSINQAILGAFLRKHKIHYEIAKNGQEAVDKWRKGGFHLVLMDIQLPVKSGIEATKEIRYLERINRIGVFAQHELSGANNSPLVKEEENLDLKVFRSPVIIVALTASSNSSVDKNNALTAGCNDFLTKPVNLVWLQNKITEWGCMQSLINFDRWRAKGSTGDSTTSDNLKPSKAKPLTSGRQEKVSAM